jgi:hypothetical protein
MKTIYVGWEADTNVLHFEASSSSGAAFLAAPRGPAGEGVEFAAAVIAGAQPKNEPKPSALISREYRGPIK